MEYADALADLITCIMRGTKLEDEAMEGLVEHQDEPANRKALVMSLQCHGLITHEQAAFAIAYRWPLKGE